MIWKDFKWSPELIALFAFAAAFTLNRFWEVMKFNIERRKIQDDEAKKKLEGQTVENMIEIVKMDKKLDSIIEKLQTLDRCTDRILTKSESFETRLSRIEVMVNTKSNEQVKVSG